MRRKYYLPETAEYTCKEGFKLKGHKIINCSHSGTWTTPPHCSHQPYITNESRLNPFHAIVPLLIIRLVLVFIIFSVKYKLKLRTKRKLLMKMEKVQLDITLMELSQLMNFSYLHEENMNHEKLLTVHQPLKEKDLLMPLFFITLIVMMVSLLINFYLN